MDKLTGTSTGKEALKGVVATVGAGVVGGGVAAIAQAIASSLSVAIELFGELGAKRSSELFDSQELVDSTLQKINQSDDFASFVFDVWQKHNLESSQKRRRMLRALLEKEVGTSENSFENFSKLEFLVQNMSLESLRLLKFFNTTVYKTAFKYEDGQPKNPSLQEIADLAGQSGYRIHYQDLEYGMNDLVNNGLVAASYGLYDGTQYNQAKMGFLLLDYISEILD